MTVIDEINERLSKYPGLKFKRDRDSICVSPTSPDGFFIEFSVNPGGSYTIAFEGWHEDFDDRTEALNVFALGLSNECRLKEYMRGNFAYKWTVEFLEDGLWTKQSTTGLLLFPFWRKPAIRYLQNNLISL